MHQIEYKSLCFELLYVLKSVMNLDVNSNSNINFNKLFDDRNMPSIFLFNEINNSIENL